MSEDRQLHHPFHQQLFKMIILEELQMLHAWLQTLRPKARQIDIKALKSNADDLERGF